MPTEIDTNLPINNPDTLCVWNIYLDLSYILAPNAGKYSSPMEHMDKV